MIFTAHVKSGAEHDTAASLIKAGITAYAPVREVFERRKGKWSLVRRIIFPGYVFIELEELTTDAYYLIHSIKGVIRLLGSPPAPLSKDEEDRLRRIFDAGELTVSKGYVIDGRIVITDGILKGMEQHIVKYDVRHRRCTLFSEINGRRYYFDVSAELKKL